MTNVGPSARVRPPVPDPVFEVLGAEPVAHAAAPTLKFTLRVTSERPLHAIALSAQINIDPARRTYDDDTRARLVELFGPAERWAATTRSFLWTQVGALVPRFSGSADFTLTVPCTYDLELSAAKYFYSLPDGEIPLTFHFSGTILYPEEAGVQIAMVPWSCSARYKLAVEDWKRMMALYYPGGGWVRLQTSTLDRLQERKAEAGLPSFDACVAELLDA
jgi:hypothetical protein